MRILLADNRPRVRFALRALLQRQQGWKVVGEAVDAEDLLAQTEETCPDLVLLDWELPGLAGVDLLSTLHRACPHVFVIALSGRVRARQEALAAGADAFVSKGEPPERLLAAIDVSRSIGRIKPNLGQLLRQLLDCSNIRRYWIPPRLLADRGEEGRA